MKIDIDNIKKIIAETTDEIARGSLIILLKSYQQTRQEYGEEPTSAHLRNWQDTEAALIARVNEIEGPGGGSAALSNLLAVVDHLTAQGWKVKKSAAYNHRKEGKIRPQPDGSFRIADVERYAETYLRRKDGSESGKLDKLQERKLNAEIAKTEAQTEHWVNRARASSGSFVPKEQHERDLARRAAVFRTDLETFARSEASEIVSLVSGDAGKIPELVTWILGRFDGFLANYSEEREFTVPLLPAEKDPDADLDEGEDEENEG